jgi:metallo-beta-lactamase family protein
MWGESAMSRTLETVFFESPKFIHHGAVDGVTGSCHQYQLAADYSLLIDCGLFQGNEQGPGSDLFYNRQFNIDIGSIKALLLTHVHIDHCGRLPNLIAAGYRGPILLTHASAKLFPLVLQDALKTGYQLSAAQIELLIEQIVIQLQPCAFGQWIPLPAVPWCDTAPAVRFQVAGHILGSAYLEIKHKIKKAWFKTVFSGDLGPPYTPLLPAPKPPSAADVLVLESTYGDRCHQGRRERQQQLEKIILAAMQDNGSLLIPAFSIGRTQELLYELEAILQRLKGQKIHQQLAWSELAIIVDSPLAVQFTTAYLQLQQDWDQEAKRKVKQGRHPLDFSQFTTVKDHEQHLLLVNLLASTATPAIVIAGSGMCTGGRIVDYLKAMLPDRRHQVLFVGYQARGTPGAAIIKAAATGSKSVRLQQTEYPLAAEVIVLSGYSAHADQQDLIRFVQGMKRAPKQIRLIHGDGGAKRSLQQKLQQLGFAAIIATSVQTV